MGLLTLVLLCVAVGLVLLVGGKKLLDKLKGAEGKVIAEAKDLEAKAKDKLKL